MSDASMIPDEYRAWLETLDDEQLLDCRFGYYDRAEVAGRDSDVYRFAAQAVKVICELEKQRVERRDREVVREVCVKTSPGVDADVMADAFVAIETARRQLGAPYDLTGLWSAALEVAERRATDDTGGKD